MCSLRFFSFCSLHVYFIVTTLNGNGNSGDLDTLQYLTKNMTFMNITFVGCVHFVWMHSDP